MTFFFEKRCRKRCVDDQRRLVKRIATENGSDLLDMSDDADVANVSRHDFAVPRLSILLRADRSR